MTITKVWAHGCDLMTNLPTTSILNQNANGTTVTTQPGQGPNIHILTISIPSVITAQPTRVTRAFLKFKTLQTQINKMTLMDGTENYMDYVGAFTSTNEFI